MAQESHRGLEGIFNVPYNRDLSFMGRGRGVLEELRSRPGTHVLVGPEGIGKAQMAVEYAYRNAGGYDHIGWMLTTSPWPSPSVCLDLITKTG